MRRFHLLKLHSGWSLQSCVHGGYKLCQCTPSCVQYSGYEGAIAGHALRAEVGGGTICLTLGEVHWFAQKCALCILGDGSKSIYVMPYMPALAGLHSLHGYYACMVCWVKGAFRRNRRQILYEISFSPIESELFIPSRSK